MACAVCTRLLQAVGLSWKYWQRQVWGRSRSTFFVMFFPDLLISYKYKHLTLKKKKSAISGFFPCLPILATSFLVSTMLWSFVSVLWPLDHHFMLLWFYISCSIYSVCHLAPLNFLSAWFSFYWHLKTQFKYMSSVWKSPCPSTSSFKANVSTPSSTPPLNLVHLY